MRPQGTHRIASRLRPFPACTAPTVRGFVTLLWEGTQGASVDDLAALSYDLISQAGLKEILGMQRMNGLAGVLRRLKKIVVETAAS